MLGGGDIQINANSLQEDNLQAFQDSITSSPELNFHHQNCDDGKVMDEKQAQTDIRDSITSSPELVSKSLEEKIKPENVSPDTHPPNINIKKELMGEVQVMEVMKRQDDDICTNTAITRTDNSSGDVEVSRGDEVMTGDEMIVNKDNKFAITVNPFNDGSTQFNIGDNIQYCGNLPPMKKKFKGVLEVSVIASGQIKFIKEDGSESHWISHLNDFKLVNPSKIHQ